MKTNIKCNFCQEYIDEDLQFTEFEFDNYNNFKKFCNILCWIKSINP